MFLKLCNNRSLGIDNQLYKNYKAIIGKNEFKCLFCVRFPSNMCSIDVRLL